MIADLDRFEFGPSRVLSLLLTCKTNKSKCLHGIFVGPIYGQGAQSRAGSASGSLLRHPSFIVSEGGAEG
jgi:hypothetical protein